MDSTVLLMCGGKQTRMGAYDGPKQLVQVCGEPLLARTIRLVRAVDPTTRFLVVADRTPVWDAFIREHRCALTSPAHPLFIQALLAHMPRGSGSGGGSHLVLCGDVVFSPRGIATLFEDHRMTFLGRFTPNLYTGRAAGELFGFSFAESQDGVIRGFIEKGIAQLDRIREDMRRAGAAEDLIATVAEKNYRLWHLMHELEERGAVVRDVAIDDYMDDIDGPDDLERLPRIEAVIQREVVAMATPIGDDS